MIEQLDLSLLQVFTLVARSSSFTKAAETLKVSRSHISRQISQLEKNLSMTLLKRSTRRLKLTQQGSQVLAVCESVFSQLDSTLIELIDETHAPSGHLRLNCVGGYVGEILVAKMCQSFMQKYPNISITLEFSSQRIDLIENEFDVAFRMGELEDASYIARPILNLPMCTLASPEYLKRQEAPKTPKELINHNCLTGSISKWCYQHKVNKSKRESLVVNGNLKCKNGQVLVSSALEGLGIIRVPQCYCKDKISEQQLIEIFNDWHIPDIQLSMIYQKDNFQPKSLQLFIEYVANGSNIMKPHNLQT